MICPETYPRISRGWAQELQQAEDAFPGLSSRLSAYVTIDAGISGREFGFFDDDDERVGLSPRLEAEPDHRLRAIMRHELGHAVDYIFAPAVPGAEGAEARADEIALRVWGSPLTYDEFDVQTTRTDGGPRPGHLHR
ncbi:hypothetical protein CMI37_07520 [Candidatus Pacearchaeota archaeon]|nr:hypothetical protein [Candidatus Pacearchaeota archaeon]